MCSGELTLDRNDFTGTIPEELGNLQKAYDISMTVNMLQGSVPNSMCLLREAGTLQRFEVDSKLGCTCCTNGCARPRMDC
mmetsp:Transcript_14193/g.21600  ORF Transcript_14193/g.21600 Transcript_14193/m.21600 type:complete len:80 (+) Transcript_14193:805-1044(+)